MIKLYTWTTPNGRKISILLEELGFPYEAKPINLSKNEQFSPEFLKISPNNKIPAITDDGVMVNGAPISVFESGAILTYLAEKSGRFLAPSGAQRFKALEWLYWQMSAMGPMFGQFAFFAVRSPEKAALAIDRFTVEVDRLLGVMEVRLSTTPYFAGDEYSIADMAIYPWMITAKTGLKTSMEEKLANRPSIDRWLKLVGDRPAVARGMDVPKIQV